MKAIFVAYNQAYNEEVVEVLEAYGQRGYTAWQDIQGRGSVDGIPHLGNHAWPEMNHALLAMVDDDKVDGILDSLRAKDAESRALGLRAYVWNIEQAL
jgi:nitrogen regulatory protein PII